MEPTASSRSSIERKGPGEGGAARPGAIPVGRVVGAHGLRGALRVRIFTDAVESLFELTRVCLARSEEDPEAIGFDVRSVAPGRPGELRVDLEGLCTRDDALAQRGRLVMAAPGELPALAPGEYYGYQLLGCRVEDEAGRVIGSVHEIWETGASDLLVVVDAGGAQHLLPAALLRCVDLAGRRIVVEILPGLLAAE